MRPVARAGEFTPQLLFLPGVYNEALALLFDAHHYFQQRGSEEQAAMSQNERKIFSGEMSLVTTRLISAMAWIMVRRAVNAGRIDEARAADGYRLDGVETCLAAPDDRMLDAMPYYLGYLAHRSHELYARVWRLDRMAYGEMPPMPPEYPRISL